MPRLFLILPRRLRVRRWRRKVARIADETTLHDEGAAGRGLDDQAMNVNGGRRRQRKRRFRRLVWKLAKLPISLLACLVGYSHHHILESNEFEESFRNSSSISIWFPAEPSLDQLNYWMQHNSLGYTWAF